MCGDTLGLLLVVLLFMMMHLIPKGGFAIAYSTITTIFFIVAAVMSWFAGIVYLTKKHVSNDKTKNPDPPPGKEPKWNVWEDHLSGKMFNSL